jgi:hypothetical protein
LRGLERTDQAKAVEHGHHPAEAKVMSIRCDQELALDRESSDVHVRDDEVRRLLKRELVALRRRLSAVSNRSQKGLRSQVTHLLAVSSFEDAAVGRKRRAKIRPDVAVVVDDEDRIRF